jgi:outer membrane protein TolC
MKKIIGMLIVLLSFLGSLSAQTLNWLDVQNQVLEYHPLARQSKLLQAESAAALTRARGGFDPKFFAGYSNKNFNGKDYFEFAQTGLKLPTWAGLELKASYQYAAGEYLNPENKLPKNGQANVGLEWSIWQGLLFDERRAGLQMAQIGFGLNEKERLVTLNDLLFEAAKAYWNWVLAQQSWRVAGDARQQAQLRHNGLVESFRQGDKPAMDTLESFIQVQTRSLDFQFAQTEAQNTALLLASFLWNNNNQRIAIDSIPEAPDLFATRVDPTTQLGIDALLVETRLNHPEIQGYQYKLQQLSTELRLKNEKRKPMVTLQYNLLGDGWSFFPTGTPQGVSVLANDIKWGLDINYSLLNRKARGDVQLAKIKRAQTVLALEQKINQVETKVLFYANTVQNLRAQVILFRDMTSNFRALLAAEMERFSQGESSVFLINSREQRWLDTLTKELKLRAELQKAEVGLKWASGVLAQ